MLGVGDRGRAGAGAAGAYLTRILWPQFPVTAIREIKILKVLNHKNVVQLKEIVTSKGALCPGGRGERGRRRSRLVYSACGLICGAACLRGSGACSGACPRTSLSQQASTTTARGRSTWSWSSATTISRG